MSVLKYALKKAGVVTDEDIERIQKEDQAKDTHRRIMIAIKSYPPKMVEELLAWISSEGTETIPLPLIEQWANTSKASGPDAVYAAWKEYRNSVSKKHGV